MKIRNPRHTKTEIIIVVKSNLQLVM